MAALLAISIVLIAALIGPIVWDQDYALADFQNILSSPNPENPMGTDGLGRDILARVFEGTRVSLAVAFGSQILAIVFATVVGLVAGYSGGKIDAIVMRAIDVIMSIPDLLLLVLLAPLMSGALGASIMPQFVVNINESTGGALGLILAIALITWTIVARLVRGQVLSLREQEFVEGALAIGASRMRIMARHLLPSLITVLIVAATLGVPRGILLEAGISFLGLGVNPPTPSLGTMIADGIPLMRSSSWVLIGPAAVLSLAVLTLNVLGDAIRDVVDPRGSVDISRGSAQKIDR